MPSTSARDDYTHLAYEEQRWRDNGWAHEQFTVALDEIDELRRYAGLLAWIMQPTEDRAGVEDTAVHVWRISLTLEDHARLDRFLPDDLRESDVDS